MRGKLTDTWLRNYNGKQTEKEITKSDGNGLEARLRRGTISFIYRPRLKTGERIKMTLGRYPDMSLAKAREKASSYRSVVQSGGDPRKTKQADIIKQTQEPTLDDVYSYWHEYYCKPKRDNHAATKKNYQRHIGEKYGKLYYRDLSRYDIVQHLMGKAATIPSMTQRVLAELKQAINYCIDHDYLQHDNIIGTLEASHLGIQRKKGQRRLNEAEIKQVLEASERYHWHERNKIIVKLLLFYGCRSGELRQTRHSWIDFKRNLWVIPAQYHKTGEQTGLPLIRPITPEAKVLWERAIELSPSGEYVFTNMRAKGDLTETPMTKGAMLHISVSLCRWLNRQDPEEWPRMEAFSNHDLRRTARTFWSSFGEWAVCEKMMGHKIPGDADVYDGYDYADKMLPVYKWWWSKLEAIQYGEGKVVSMRA